MHLRTGSSFCWRRNRLAEPTQEIVPDVARHGVPEECCYDNKNCGLPQKELLVDSLQHQKRRQDKIGRLESLAEIRVPNYQFARVSAIAASMRATQKCRKRRYNLQNK